MTKMMKLMKKMTTEILMQPMMAITNISMINHNDDSNRGNNGNHDVGNNGCLKIT